MRKPTPQLPTNLDKIAHQGVTHPPPKLRFKLPIKPYLAHAHLPGVWPARSQHRSNDIGEQASYEASLMTATSAHRTAVPWRER